MKGEENGVANDLLTTLLTPDNPAFDHQNILTFVRV
jgi:hypothetical protein